MRQSKAGECKCPGVKVTDNLWLCPHQAWGWATNLVGAEEEGRRLLKAAGGYQAMLERQETVRNGKKRDNRRGKSGGH